MFQTMYSIRDIKSSYQFPFTLPNDEVAIRTFKMLCKDDSTDIGKFAEDMELWKCGHFDTETGVVTIDGLSPEYMIGGRDIV